MMRGVRSRNMGSVIAAQRQLLCLFLACVGDDVYDATGQISRPEQR
jgi:hypothetical protein